MNVFKIGSLWSIRNNIEDPSLNDKICGIIGEKGYISTKYPIYIFETNTKLDISANVLSWANITDTERTQYTTQINNIINSQTLEQQKMTQEAYAIGQQKIEKEKQMEIERKKLEAKKKLEEEEMKKKLKLEENKRKMELERIKMEEDMRKKEEERIKREEEERIRREEEEREKKEELMRESTPVNWALVPVKMLKEGVYSKDDNNKIAPISSPKENDNFLTINDDDINNGHNNDTGTMMVIPNIGNNLPNLNENENELNNNDNETKTDTNPFEIEMNEIDNNKPEIKESEFDGYVLVLFKDLDKCVDDINSDDILMSDYTIKQHKLDERARKREEKLRLKQQKQESTNNGSTNNGNSNVQFKITILQPDTNKQQVTNNYNPNLYKKPLFGSTNNTNSSPKHANTEGEYDNNVAPPSSAYDNVGSVSKDAYYEHELKKSKENTDKYKEKYEKEKQKRKLEKEKRKKIENELYNDDNDDNSHKKKKKGKKNKTCLAKCCSCFWSFSTIFTIVGLILGLFGFVIFYSSENRGEDIVMFGVTFVRNYGIGIMAAGIFFIMFGVMCWFRSCCKGKK